ncbi:MAG: hypothetical protein WCI18_02745 [Pseudomonadota bacterium]
MPERTSVQTLIEFYKSSKKAVFNGGFLIQYGVSLGSGVAGFLSLAMLGRVLPSEAMYSAVAAILATFSTYFVFFDLGYTSELMRDLNTAPPARREEAASQGFLSLLYLRFLICLLVIPLSLVQGFISGADGDHVAAFGIFSLSFLFFAFFSTLDTVYFAEAKPIQAVSTKMLRLAASLTLPVIVYIRTDLNLSELFLAYLAILSVFSLMAFVLNRHTIKKLFHLGWIPKSEPFKSFLVRCMKSSLTPSLTMLGAFFIQTALYRGEGLGSLSTYVAGVSLISPISTMMQTLSSLVQRDLILSVTSDLKLAKLQVYRTSGLIALVGFLGILSVIGLYKIGLINFFLKHIDDNFSPIFALLGVQITVATIYTQFFNVLQFRKRYRLLFKTGVLLNGVGVPVVAYLSLKEGIMGSLYGGCLLSLATLIVYFWLFKKDLAE